MATITQLLIFFILINSIPIPTFSCPLDQKQALLHFKSNITTLFNVSLSNHYNPFESWTRNSDCCPWETVICSETGTVTELRLSDIRPLDDLTTVFVDILTPIFHIQSLEQLDISRNHFVGEIPGDGLGNLTQLLHLDISSNNFSGSIPDQIFGLTKLSYLDMSNNFLEGNLGSLWNLTSLQYLETLDLRMNSLSGNIPEEIGNLTKLREFLLRI